MYSGVLWPAFVETRVLLLPKIGVNLSKSEIGKSDLIRGTQMWKCCDSGLSSHLALQIYVLKLWKLWNGGILGDWEFPPASTGRRSVEKGSLGAVVTWSNVLRTLKALSLRFELYPSWRETPSIVVGLQILQTKAWCLKLWQEVLLQCLGPRQRQPVVIFRICVDYYLWFLSIPFRIPFRFLSIPPFFLLPDISRCFQFAWVQLEVLCRRNLTLLTVKEKNLVSVDPRWPCLGDVFYGRFYGKYYRTPKWEITGNLCMDIPKKKLHIETPHRSSCLVRLVS